MRGETLTSAEHTAIGALAGMIEACPLPAMQSTPTALSLLSSYTHALWQPQVCTFQPTVGVKNALQEGRPVPTNPRLLYRGLVVSLSISALRSTSLVHQSSLTKVFCGTGERWQHGAYHCCSGGCQTCCGAAHLRLSTTMRNCSQLSCCCKLHCNHPGQPFTILETPSSCTLDPQDAPHCFCCSLEPTELSRISW